MSTNSGCDSTDTSTEYFDDEFLASVMLSHRIDEEEMAAGRYRPLRLMVTRADTANVPSGHVRVILVDGYSYLGLQRTPLARVDVPRTMTIKDLRKELYVSALSSSSVSGTSLSSVLGRGRSPEELRESYCDYEFSLSRYNEGSLVSRETLPDASLCGDHVTSVDPQLLGVKVSFTSAYSGSTRTIVPGNYEWQEKQAFMTVVQNLPNAKFNLVVLSVGACTPEQVLPNFAIDAAELGYKVCILSVNPGFYHGICPCMGDLRGQGSMRKMLFLAYNRHLSSHKCTTIYDQARAWKSWEKTERGDFAGKFVLTHEASDSLNGGYMEMHTFAMSWPGRPANRDLDDAILHTVSQTIPFLCTTTCHFVAFFTTWENETDYHVAHLSQWRTVVPFFNSFHAILDQYTTSTRFHVFKNIDLAISRTAHLHDDEMLNALGGRRMDQIAAVSLDDLGFFEVV